MVKTHVTIRSALLSAALVFAMGMFTTVFGVETEQAQTENVQQVQDGAAISEQIDLDSKTVQNMPESEELVSKFMMTKAEEDLGEAQVDSKKRRSKLNDNSKKFYDLLKKEIEKIANGERESSIISIKMSDVFGKTTFTAEELGVEALVEEDGEGNLYISDEAEAAMLDFDKVLNALLADVPYELYWFDKTEGSEVELDYYSCEYDQSKNMILYDADATFVFYLPTSYDYLPTGDSDGYTIDKQLTGAPKEAARIAASIVDHADDEVLTDYSRLDYYKDEICERVKYNEEAADDDIQYGDPWQLIWVFDNDPKTDVVCEGYSKAYKFLCDLTEFDNSNVGCDLMTGTLSFEGGSGNHMWNLVAMSNGNNYLVDITNCDEETEDEEWTDTYFLKGAENGTSERYTVEDLTYEYDDETKSIFDKGERSIAEADYDPGNDKAPARTSIKHASLSGITNRTYSGGRQNQHPTVKINGKTLKAGTDFEIAYDTNNINVGTVKFTIKGIGAYKGKLSGTFRIDPKATTIRSLKKAKKSFTVKWNKQTSQVSGYQIRYSLKKNFKSKVKTVTVNGASKASYKVKKLKAKKNYYVQIRTFTNVGGVKYYSGWSKVKKVKTR